MTDNNIVSIARRRVIKQGYLPTSDAIMTEIQVMMHEQETTHSKENS